MPEIILHERFDSLLHEVCRGAVARAPSPRPQPVVVPSIPFSDHLQLAVAKKLGICMGMEFLTPSVFIARVTGRAEDPPWSKERLVWSILPHARDFARHLGLERGKASMRDLFAVSELLADRLDQYGHFRPEMIRAWNAGRSFFADGNADEAWQRDLWIRLRDELGPDVPHPAVALERFRNDKALCERVRAAFPEITLIGTGSIDPLLVGVLEFLRDAGTAITMHVLLPSKNYLGDLRRRDGVLEAARKDPGNFFDDAAHPLVASMGRHAVGAFLLLEKLDEGSRMTPEFDARDAEEPPGSQSLLARLQSDMRGLSLPQPLDPPAGRDGSIGVHSCFGPRREMEVLRDEILRAFRDIPDLRPEDIHIVTPSLETYAPLVPAVLGQIMARGGDGAEDAPHDAPLWVRVTELPEAGQNPLVAGLLALLEMASSARHEASSLLGLLHLEPVQRMLGAGDDAGRLRGIIRDSGLTRGLGNVGATPATGTWAFARERLVGGLWMGGELAACYPDGAFVLPVAGDLGGESEVVRSFVGWQSKLEETMRDWSKPACARDWARRLGGAMTGLLGCRDGEDLAMRPHLLFLESLDGSEKVDAGTIRDWLDGVTADERRRSPNSGKITFGRFRQLQNLPCKVLAMVGMQDAAFPGRSRLPAWDLLQAVPETWDRNPRIEDRQLFLDALLAPEKRLIITGSTRNIRTNKDEPFSSCIDELLRVLAAMGVPSGKIVIKHPLQPFSPFYFTGAPQPDLPRSFSATNAAVARAIEAGGRKDRPFWAGEGARPEPGPVAIEITLHDLVGFWKDPAKAYVKAQGVRLPLDGEGDEELDRTPVQLGVLEKWKIKDAVLQEVLCGGAGLDLVKAQLAANRSLPMGGLGDHVWNENKDVAGRFGARVRAMSGDAVPVVCELHLTNNAPGVPDFEVRVTGQVHLTADGTHLLAYRAGEANEPKHFIQPWIEAVFAAHAGHNLPTIFLSETHPDACAINTLEKAVSDDAPDRAEGLMRDLVTGCLLGRQRPLCYAPATSGAIAKNLAGTSRTSPMEPAAAVAKARADKWDPAAGSSGRSPNDGESYAAKLAWRDRDPFEDRDAWLHLVDKVASPLREWGRF